MSPSSTSVSPVTRRRFLAFSGVAAAGALGLGATRVDWAQLLDAAATNPLDPAAGVLVVVTLYGGNDGLNTVVPAADPAYQAARPDLAYRSDEVLDLGEGLGLNPGLTGLKGLWDAGQLAVVRGVGYPQADRSHFRSMAIWQTASPVSSATTGWLGRWLDATTTDPLAAVSLESVLPALLAGEKVAAASFPLGGLRLPGGRLGAALQLLGPPGPGRRAVAGQGGDVAGRPAAGRRHARPGRRTRGADGRPRRRANRRRPTSSRTRAARPAAPDSSAPSWTWWPT